MKMFDRPVRQIAYFAADIEAAVRRHAQTYGSGPFFMAPPTTAVGTYRGQETEFVSRYCCGQWGDVMVEFVHSSGEPTILDEFYRQGKGRGVHHIALIVDDLDEEIARLDALGYPVAFLGFPKGAPDFRFAFIDTTADFGHFVEIYPSHPSLLNTYARVKDASLNFDGKDVFRQRDW